jgi:hypothetical protein
MRDFIIILIKGFMHFIRFVFFSLLMLTVAPCLFGEQGMQALAQASRENRHLFIFFYKDQNERTATYQKVFDQAMQKVGHRANFVKINVSDPAEKPLVDKFNLKRSPMPLVLVLAPNGAVAGSFFANFSEQQLLDSFSSPGMAACLKALQDQKLLFLCLQNQKTTHNETAMQGIRDFTADPRFASASVVVLIDPSDEREQKFLMQLAADPHALQATTLFISPPAVTIGQYKGATSKEQFVADLQQAVTPCCPGGCCPGGCCCPGGRCQ